MKVQTEQNNRQEVSSPHTSVLLKEVLFYLQPKDGKNYLDCTFGAGGYSRAILKAANCSVKALDQDCSVQIYADELKKEFPDRFSFMHTNFAQYLRVEESIKYDAIILDLGVSSMQLDQGKRGFSFMHDGPLDMRMSSHGMSAEDFVREASEEEIANVIYKYGNETASRKIARNICQKRVVEPIRTTGQLAAIVRSSLGAKKGKIDPATKTFQAIRIYVNNELQNLEDSLDSVYKLLTHGGKIIVVSFHSLEDKIVKYFFRSNSSKNIARSKYAPAAEIEDGKWLQIITKKPIVPGNDELRLNPRARSAKLRVAAKKEANYDN